MDFWKVEDGKIAYNWVMVDFPHVLAQLGVDKRPARPLHGLQAGGPIIARKARIDKRPVDEHISQPDNENRAQDRKRGVARRSKQVTPHPCYKADRACRCGARWFGCPLSHACPPPAKCVHCTSS